MIYICIYSLQNSSISAMISGTPSPCLSSSVFPPPPSQSVSKAKFTHRLTHFRPANLKHRHTHTHAFSHTSVLFSKRIEHHPALSPTHSDSVCDGKSKTMSSQRQRVHAYWSLFTFSHRSTKAEFQTEHACKCTHTLLKCTYGREAGREGDIHGMNSKVLVSRKEKFKDLIQKKKTCSLTSRL